MKSRRIDETPNEEGRTEPESAERQAADGSAQTYAPAHVKSSRPSVFCSIPDHGEALESKRLVND
jgi:hypothetical protein